MKAFSFSKIAGLAFIMLFIAGTYVYSRQLQIFPDTALQANLQCKEADITDQQQLIDQQQQQQDGGGAGGGDPMGVNLAPRETIMTCEKCMQTCGVAEQCEGGYAGCVQRGNCCGCVIAKVNCCFPATGEVFPIECKCPATSYNCGSSCDQCAGLPNGGGPGGPAPVPAPAAPAPAPAIVAPAPAPAPGAPAPAPAAPVPAPAPSAGPVAPAPAPAPAPAVAPAPAPGSSSAASSRSSGGSSSLSSSSSSSSNGSAGSQSSTSGGSSSNVSSASSSSSSTIFGTSSSTGTGSSSSSSSDGFYPCTGIECMLGGDQACASLIPAQQCVLDPLNPPNCFVCVGGNKSSSSFGFFSSSARSSSSTGFGSSSSTSGGSSSSVSGGSSSSSASVTSSSRSSTSSRSSVRSSSSSSRSTTNQSSSNGTFSSTSSTPSNPFCGDGITSGSEACDDGNDVNTDSCSNSCTRGTQEPCTNALQCASALCVQGRCAPVCTKDMDCAANERCTNAHCVARICGDGLIDPGETCDAGNRNRSPGIPGATCACSPEDPKCTKSFDVSWALSCMWARCGDGVVNNLAVFQGRTVNYDLVHEQCDDGSANGAPGNPCSKTCQLLLAQAVDITFCGNGRLDTGEQCDDGLLNGKTVSQCSSTCALVRGTGAGNDFEPPKLAAGDSTSIELPLLPGQYGNGTNANVNTSLTTIATHNPPAGQTGPASLAVMAAGAAAGYAWVRRRRAAQA